MASNVDDDLPWYTIGSSETQKMQYRKAQADLEARENVRRAKIGLKPVTEAQDAYNRAVSRSSNKPLAPANKQSTQQSGRVSPIVERAMPGNNEFVTLNPARRSRDAAANRNVAPGMGDKGTNIREYPSVTAGRGTMKGMPPAKPNLKRNNQSNNPLTEDYDEATRNILKKDPNFFRRQRRPDETIQYDGGTLNPSEFGPATMGPGVGVERGNVTSQGTTRNYEDEFPVEMFNPSSMTMAAPMREGLFGEQISQEDYDAMTQRNKDAGFYSRFKKGGSVKKKPAKKMAKGGSVSSASKRGDGCCQRGKTKGRMV